MKDRLADLAEVTARAGWGAARRGRGDERGRGRRAEARSGAGGDEGGGVRWGEGRAGPCRRLG